MSRWLVVAALCTSTAAAAEPPPIAPLACQCSSNFILPARGSTVPYNAHVWIFGTRKVQIDGTFDAGDGTDIVPPFDHADVKEFWTALKPGREYTFRADEYSTAFKTNGDVDTTPPHAPDVRGVTIKTWPADRHQVTPHVVRLELDATFSKDTAVVEIDIEDGLGTHTLLTVPGRLALCDPELVVSPGEATVRIAALDLSGNHSDFVALPPVLVTEVDQSYEDPCSERRRDPHDLATMNSIALGGVVVFFGTIAFLVVMAIMATLRAREDANESPYPIALLVAEPLARGARRARVIELALELGVLVGGWSVGMYPIAIVAILIAITIDRLLKTRRVLRLLADPAVAGAELRGTMLTACAHGSHASIRVSRRAIASARVHGVPKADLL